MKHLELHILQSVPVACLNRDDLNSPKTAVFGGIQRARVSSQSWKRAIREMAKEISPEQFMGKRTRLLYAPLVQELINTKLDEKEADEVAKKIVDALVNLDKKSKDVVKSKTLYFMSPNEMRALVAAYVEKKDVKKSLKQIKADALVDAADISLFGRMVANEPSLNIEAASLFSHALSTHKADNEIDFFSAVDDLQSDEESGAGMTSTLEFNSATYYRFCALNLDMLADNNHLGSISKEERQQIVKTFVEATLKAVPGARKNTMNSNTMPSFILGIVRTKGHPIQLVNAFETPVWSNNGYTQKSIDKLKEEYENLKATWGLEAIYEQSIPDIGVNDFLEGVINHVD